MLALSLCCVGFGSCRTVGLKPAVTQGPQGNAVVATLPAGTRLVVERGGEVILAAFANEVSQAGPGPTENSREPIANSQRAVVLTKPLVLCTPAYLAERDMIEFNLRESLRSARQAGGAK